MKKTSRLLLLAVSALTLASCDKGTQGFEVNYFSFRSDNDGKWGMMDTDGKVLFKKKFNNAPQAAVNGRFSVYDDDKQIYSIYTAEENPRKIGDYKDVGAFTSDVCPVVGKDGYMQLIDKEGNKVASLKKIDGKEVHMCYDFFCGRAMVKLVDESWGFIDETGKTVIPFKYADAWNFNDDVAIVYLDTPDSDDEEDDDGKWGVVDKDGNMLFTKKFKDMRPSAYRYDEGMLIVYAKGKLAIIDKEGNTLAKVKGTSSSSNIFDGKFVFYDDEEEKFGLASTSGEILLRPKYSSLTYNGKLLAGSTDDEKYYLLSPTGEKLAKLPGGWPQLFDKEYRNFDTRLLAGSYDEGYKLIDAQGKKIDTEAKIGETNTSYFTLAIVSQSEEEDEYDYYDDDEEVDVDEDFDGDEDIEVDYD